MATQSPFSFLDGLLQRVLAGPQPPAWLVHGLGLALRLCAIWRGWKLPTFSYRQRWD